MRSKQFIYLHILHSFNQRMHMYVALVDILKLNLTPILEKYVFT